jgi:hypothetical protein
MNCQTAVKCPSDNSQMEFGIGMDIHNGYYIQYSTDDRISNMVVFQLHLRTNRR